VFFSKLIRFLGKPIDFGDPYPYSLTITDSTYTNISMPVEVNCARYHTVEGHWCFHFGLSTFDHITLIITSINLKIEGPPYAKNSTPELLSKSPPNSAKKVAKKAILRIIYRVKI